MSSDFAERLASVSHAVQAYQGAVDDFDREFARILGVNSTDLRCLEALITDPETEFTPRILGDRLGLTSGSVTTMLDRLERAGYVARVRHEEDRRKIVVSATPLAQRSIWGLMSPFLDEVSADVTAHFTADELEIVDRFLRRSTSVQERHVERLRGEHPLG